MTDERFLVTGALGCIGAWTVKRLVDEGTVVWTYDLGSSNHRLKLIMDDESLEKVNLVSGDITDFDSFDRVVAENGITHIVHLAAFQVPFVRAEPVLGAKVNLVGMSVVLESAKRHLDQIRGLAYASSAAVYGPPGQGFQTTSLYGIHKQAKEGMARIYSQDYGLHAVGLRPHTVYGPGRDQGMTSTPTKAMLAAAVGRPYQITFGGTIVMEHADDMAQVFIDAARAKPERAGAYDVGGNTVAVEEIVNAINTAAPEMAGQVTYNPTPLPVSSTQEEQPLHQLLGKLNWRPLGEGVRQTIEHFKKAVSSNRIDVERAIT
ncbi:MAG: NAD(P)-dependent oxidoreductase [Chloroflexi bacterium]|nr:NAD(P)-dependent oxidoreductase [Chloroflexota bacterium]MCC6893861.1 NAD(P)-dependent oxidoreductase [Anaerolineae bacterium]